MGAGNCVPQYRERAKRRGILGLLYAKAVHDPEHASMTAVTFEEMLGCPREHLQAAITGATALPCKGLTKWKRTR